MAIVLPTEPDKGDLFEETKSFQVATPIFYSY